MNIIPPGLLQNMGLSRSRQYKALKRRQVKQILRLMADLNRGSMAMPRDTYLQMRSVVVAMRSVGEKCRADRWGR